MAKLTVQPKQTVAAIAKTNNISEDQFYLANPGVKTLRPGQVVRIPNPPQAGFQTPTTNGFTAQPPKPPVNPFAGAQAGTGGTNANGNGFYNSPSNSNGAAFSYAPAGYNSYASLNTPVVKPPSQANFQTPTTNGFTAPAGYTNLTPSQSQNIPPSAGYTDLTPSQSQPTNQTPQTQTTQQSGIPPRPTGTYTGDPNDPNTAIWKARWDWEARNPELAREQAILSGAYKPPTVMTRDQIWNMKANQRRRRMEQGDTQGGGFSGFSNAQPAQPDLVRSIVWGI